MAQPQWITPAGDLGTIAEGLFFQTPVEAVDPDGGTVQYKLIAGTLPAGIQVKSNGVVEGVPVAYALPQSWDRSKPLLYLGSGVWFLLVIAVAVLNFFVA